MIATGTYRHFGCSAFVHYDAINDSMATLTARAIHPPNGNMDVLTFYQDVLTILKAKNTALCEPLRGQLVAFLKAGRGSASTELVRLRNTFPLPAFWPFPTQPRWIL